MTASYHGGLKLHRFGVIVTGLLVLWISPTPILAAPTPTPIERGTGLELPTKRELKKKTSVSIPFEFGSARQPEKIEPPFSLRRKVPTPGDQLANNSCIGWSVGYGLMTYLAELTGKAPLSPEYLYYQSLRVSKRPPNAFVNFNAAFKALSDYGICERRLMDRLTAPPSPPAEVNARQHRLTLVELPLRTLDIDTVKKLLKEEKPLPVGMDVDAGFKTGIFPKRGKKPVWGEYTGGKKSGHAMLLIGFDDSAHAFEVLNSFGPSWSDTGYGWIDYDHFKQAASVVFDYEIASGASRETAQTALSREKNILGAGKHNWARSDGQKTFGASQNESPSNISETLFCRLVVQNSDGEFDVPTLAFDITPKEIRAGKIQPGMILTRSKRVSALFLRRKVLWEGDAGVLYPGDRFKVFQFKAYTLSSGETHYWIGGQVLPAERH